MSRLVSLKSYELLDPNEDRSRFANDPFATKNFASPSTGAMIVMRICLLEMNAFSSSKNSLAFRIYFGVTLNYIFQLLLLFFRPVQLEIRDSAVISCHDHIGGCRYSLLDPRCQAYVLSFSFIRFRTCEIDSDLGQIS